MQLHPHFSTNGGCAPEADKFHKQVATLIAKKRNILYSEAISYARLDTRCIPFSRAQKGKQRVATRDKFPIRGYRGTGSTKCQLAEEDLNLIPISAIYDNLV